MLFGVSIFIFVQPGFVTQMARAQQRSSVLRILSADCFLCKTSKMARYPKVSLCLPPFLGVLITVKSA